MIVSNDAAPEILQEMCDAIANEIQAIVSIMGEGGQIFASSARERIGDVHAGAARIMSGEIDEYSVTAEEAARSPGMREGYNLAIDFRGQRLWSLAVAASIEKARPFGRLAREWVISHLNAQREAKERAVAIQASEGRFRDFAEIASDWFWETDENLRWIYFSERFQEVTGIAPADLIGKTRREVGIGSAEPESWNKHLDDLAHRRAFRNFEYPIHNSQGEVRYLRISARPIFDSVGNFTGYRGIGTDVTDRRRAEEEIKARVEELRALGEVGQAVNSTLDLETVLRTIVTKAVDLSATDAGAIYVFDDGHQEFRLRATFGMSDLMIAAISDRHIGVGDANVGEAARRREPIQVADLREAPASALNDIILGAGYRALLVIPLLGPDRIVGALVVRRKQPGAFPRSVVDLLQTFADQSVLAIQNARLFREIEEKGRELEIASQHKSQFVANMSHELRTPLAAMLGYAELMQEGIYEPLGDKSLAALVRIRSNGKHLLGLINTVLDIAKIESGQFTLNITEYALDGVVETVRAATESLAQSKKLALNTDVTKSLPVGLGDEQRLTQVLLNLVGNAIKFTDTGEVRITARAVDGHFAVSVLDTGPGIPEQERTRIFEQFHQVDDSNTKAKGGTGLGLAIAKQIVEMHGGRIWVDSTVGKGSTFQINLPIRAEKMIA